MNEARRFLRIEGEVERPCTVASTDLAKVPGQIPDAGRIVPGREGVASVAWAGGVPRPAESAR